MAPRSSALAWKIPRTEGQGISAKNSEMCLTDSRSDLETGLKGMTPWTRVCVCVCVCECVCVCVCVRAVKR